MPWPPNPALVDDGCPCGDSGTTTGCEFPPCCLDQQESRPRRRPSPPPTLRTVHLEGVGQYRQLLFELAEPLVLSAEEYTAY
jgi:hypothetical protein